MPPLLRAPETRLAVFRRSRRNVENEHRVQYVKIFAVLEADEGAARLRSLSPIR
jgi:hypothetical protein